MEEENMKRINKIAQKKKDRGIKDSRTNDKNTEENKKKNKSATILTFILKCGLISWVLLLLIWQFGSYFYSDDFLPGPLTTFAGAGKLIASGDLQRDILISMQRVLKGWLFGIVFAVPAGLSIGHFKKVGLVFEPF